MDDVQSIKSQPYSLSFDDHQKCRRIICDRDSDTHQAPRRQYFFPALAIWVFVIVNGLAIASIHGELPESSHQLLVIFVSMTVALLYIAYLFKVRSARIREEFFSPDGAFRSTKEAIFTEDHVLIKSKNLELRLDWSAIFDIEEKEGYLLLYTDNNSAVAMPLSAINQPGNIEGIKSLHTRFRASSNA